MVGSLMILLNTKKEPIQIDDQLRNPLIYTALLSPAFSGSIRSQKSNQLQGAVRWPSRVVVDKSNLFVSGRPYALLRDSRYPSSPEAKGPKKERAPIINSFENFQPEVELTDKKKKKYITQHNTPTFKEHSLLKLKKIQKDQKMVRAFISKMDYYSDFKKRVIQSVQSDYDNSEYDNSEYDNIERSGILTVLFQPQSIPHIEHFLCHLSIRGRRLKFLPQSTIALSHIERVIEWFSPSQNPLKEALAAKNPLEERLERLKKIKDILNESDFFNNERLKEFYQKEHRCYLPEQKIKLSRCRKRKEANCFFT